MPVWPLSSYWFIPLLFVTARVLGQCLMENRTKHTLVFFPSLLTVGQTFLPPARSPSCISLFLGWLQKSSLKAQEATFRHFINTLDSSEQLKWKGFIYLFIFSPCKDLMSQTKRSLNLRRFKWFPKVDMLKDIQNFISLSENMHLFKSSPKYIWVALSARMQIIHSSLKDTPLGTSVPSQIFKMGYFLNPRSMPQLLHYCHTAR